jgi:hypothetical protein
MFRFGEVQDGFRAARRFNETSQCNRNQGPAETSHGFSS